MKKMLTMKKGEKRAKETERTKKNRQVVLQVSFVVVCSELHRTDSRRTQNTGTSPTDITVSNKL